MAPEFSPRRAARAQACKRLVMVMIAALILYHTLPGKLFECSEVVVVLGERYVIKADPRPGDATTETPGFMFHRGFTGWINGAYYHECSLDAVLLALSTTSGPVRVDLDHVLDKAHEMVADHDQTAAGARAAKALGARWNSVACPKK